MFFCLAFKNTGICSVLCISGPKSTGIYSIFCVFAWLPPTTLKRKNVVIYSILWLPKSEKSSEKCVKTVLFSDFWDLQNASSNFTLFLSTPDPEKRENPTRLKDFWGGSAAGARPRVAKAMLSFPTLHGEASPDFKGWRPSSAPPDFSTLHFIAVWAWKLLDGDLLQKYSPYVFEKSSSNRNFVGNRRLFWGASEFPKAPAKGFSRRTAANFNLLLRVKAPLCKDFSV